MVELFNFSDVTYSYRSSDPSKAEMARAFVKDENFRFKLEAEILNEENETYVMVFSNDDRIIVTFKATTSVENMKTDMEMKMVRIADVLLSEGTINHKMIHSLDWKSVKIHHGFATAYSSVAEELMEKVADLRLRAPRPIYFTAHGLGASLATLCSLDTVLSLNIGDVYVITFGLPRCGNVFWRRAYDQLVEAHWSIATR